jgi:hypothetical protein
MQGFPGPVQAFPGLVPDKLKGLLQFTGFHITAAYRRVADGDDVGKHVTAAVVKIAGKAQTILFNRLFTLVLYVFLQTVIEKEQFGTYHVKMGRCSDTVPVFIPKEADGNHGYGQDGKIDKQRKKADGLRRSGGKPSLHRPQDTGVKKEKREEQDRKKGESHVSGEWENKGQHRYIGSVNAKFDDKSVVQHIACDYGADKT